jgi:uncharacterized protein YybS (DUF2232 family)
VSQLNVLFIADGITATSTSLVFAVALVFTVGIHFRNINIVAATSSELSEPLNESKANVM